MGLLWMDSFDHYATAQIGLKYGILAGSPTIQTTGGRRSSGCIRLATGVDTVTTTTTPSGTTVVAGVAFKTSTIQLAEIFTVMFSATPQMCVCVNASGAIEVRRGDRLGTLLGTSANGVIVVSTFAYVEFVALLSNSVGTCTVKVNGTSVLTLTALNNAATTPGWSGLMLVGRSGGNQDYDDFYVLDGTGSSPLNTTLGDVRVDARMPTAEGATAAWTPLSGTDNALMVDEIPPNDDTDYNSTATVGAVDTLVTQDAPVVGATILGVQTNIYVKKTDTGTTQIAPVIRHSGTDNVGTTVSPGTTYAYTTQQYGVNPGTSAAWTEAGFNAAEFGYKRIA